MEIPSQFSSLHKCRFHFGFSLGLTYAEQTQLVCGQWRVTRSVGKAAPLASDFDWIPSPCSDGFRLCARERWCTFGDAGVIGPFVA